MIQNNGTMSSTPGPTTHRTFHQLERAALKAHETAVPWATFWPTISGDVERLQPFDRKRYHRAVRHLLALWASGDDRGQEPPGSDPWEQNDLSTADSTEPAR